MESNERFNTLKGIIEKWAPNVAEDTLWPVQFTHIFNEILAALSAADLPPVLTFDEWHKRASVCANGTQGELSRGSAKAILESVYERYKFFLEYQRDTDAVILAARDAELHEAQKESALRGVEIEGLNVQIARLKNEKHDAVSHAIDVENELFKLKAERDGAVERTRKEILDIWDDLCLWNMNEFIKRHPEFSSCDVDEDVLRLLQLRYGLSTPQSSEQKGYH